MLETRRRPFTFGRRSLGLRLLVSWCALLTVLLSTFLWMGYREVEATLLEAGGKRADAVARQLARIVGRSAQVRTELMAEVARDDDLVRYLRSPTAALMEAARARAGSLATRVPHRIALWNTSGDRLFEIAGPGPGTDGAPTAASPEGAPPTRLGSNALHTGANAAVFSQTVAAITGLREPDDAVMEEGPLGYLVVSLAMTGPAGALAVDSADIRIGLVGTEATLAVGNTAGEVWTSLSERLSALPADLTREQFSAYQPTGRHARIGALSLVADTPWAVWVEFPSSTLLAPARRLLGRGILVALGCLVIGAVGVATITARSTRPLGDLAQAAEDIAKGNYARRIGTHGATEIGQLANSFDVMAGRIEEAYRALQHSSDRTQFALTAARMGVWEVDLASSEVLWSAAMAAVYGLTPETAPRTMQSVLSCIHPDDRPLVSDALTAGREYVLEYRVIWPDQTVHWVNSRAQNPPGEQLTGARLVGVSIDVTERKSLQDALFAEKERAQVTLHSIGDAVISTNENGHVTYLNAAAERLTGWGDAEAAGQPLLDVLHIVDATTRMAAEDPAAAAMRLGKPVERNANYLLVRRDGSSALVEDSAAPIHDRNGRVTGAVIVFRDVSAARALTLKMAHLAQYDVLTGLPNRTLFADRVTHATAHARRNGTRLAVLFVDLDRFKHVNDSLGHAVGDALLQSVTRRLLACVRASDTVSRRGGDEFVLLLPDMERPGPAGALADKLIGALSEPYEILDHVLHVTASIGISIHPDDAHGVEALIGAADVAMYYAKERGGNDCQFFTAEMNVRSMTRRAQEASLRTALRRREFVLHYQPKVNLTTSTIAGMEALLRWQHPTQGLLAPAEFVNIAEECGLILPIGRWVLGEACRQARAWQDQGLPPRVMAVNVSAVEFRAKGFRDHVAAVLRDTQLDPMHLELELTETVLMADAKSTTRVLHALKDLGVRLALDDFGTGYSSLSYLSRFPIDTLKIDRSFVQGMTMGGHDATIIHAIIGMGRSLNQSVVAEGVETEEQLALLLSHRCREAQGYYFSRPVPPEDLAVLLRTELAGLAALPVRTIGA